MKSAMKSAMNKHGTPGENVEVQFMCMEVPGLSDLKRPHGMQVVYFVCMAGCMECALSDPHAEKEVRAAVESVFSFSMLAHFLSLPKADRELQLSELPYIALGICWYDHAVGEAEGRAITAALGSSAAQLPPLHAQCRTHVEAINAALQSQSGMALQTSALCLSIGYLCNGFVKPTGKQNCIAVGDVEGRAIAAVLGSSAPPLSCHCCTPSADQCWIAESVRYGVEDFCTWLEQRLALQRKTNIQARNVTWDKVRVYASSSDPHHATLTAVLG
jgi:hypothetical protein